MTEPTARNPRIAFQDRLPVAWEVLDEPPDQARLDRANHGGLALVQATLHWSEHLAVEAVDEDTPLLQEVARLEFKVNLLLEMVARLVERDLPMPPAVPVALSSERLVWWTDAPPPADSRLWLSVYVLPGVPRPLELSARVVDVAAEEGVHRVEATLPDLSLALQDVIEKLVFRQHRRRIARERQA